jgi:hypothetical protein
VAVLVYRAARTRSRWRIFLPLPRSHRMHGRPCTRPHPPQPCPPTSPGNLRTQMTMPTMLEVGMMHANHLTLSSGLRRCLAFFLMYWVLFKSSRQRSACAAQHPAFPSGSRAMAFLCRLSAGWLLPSQCGHSSQNPLQPEHCFLLGSVCMGSSRKWEAPLRSSSAGAVCRSGRAFGDNGVSKSQVHPEALCACAPPWPITHHVAGC